MWLICFISFIYKFIYLYLLELLSLNPLIIFSLLCRAFLFVQMSLLFATVVVDGRGELPHPLPPQLSSESYSQGGG